MAFFDITGTRLAIASQDPTLENSKEIFLNNPRLNSPDPTHPKSRWLASLGRFVEVTVPVISFGQHEYMRLAGNSWANTAEDGSGPRLAGYVSVCVSQGYTDATFSHVRLTIIFMTSMVMISTLPISFLLIHRLLDPVRRLVTATDRVAAGDLEAQVEVDRSDLIGTLAISFNRMTQRAGEHQEELALANERLAAANTDLEKANDDLEGKVHARTAELETANNRLSNEIAEKEDFLRAVSHDLNCAAAKYRRDGDDAHEKA